jgi:hypothetical protein
MTSIPPCAESVVKRKNVRIASLLEASSSESGEMMRTITICNHAVVCRPSYDTAAGRFFLCSGEDGTIHVSAFILSQSTGIDEASIAATIPCLYSIKRRQSNCFAVHVEGLERGRIYIWFVWGVRK